MAKSTGTCECGGERWITPEAAFRTKNRASTNAKSLHGSEPNSCVYVGAFAVLTRANGQVPGRGKAALEDFRGQPSTRKCQCEPVGHLGGKPAARGSRSILGLCLQSTRASHDALGGTAVLG